LAAFNELLQDDIARIRNRAAAIRNQFNVLNKEVEKQAFETFLAEGGNKEDYKPANDAVAEAFYKAYDTYRARRQKMQEEIDAQKAANLEAKKQILEDLRVLIDKDEETLKQTYDEFNAIQEKWKAIGEVPRDQMNDLWQNYHFLIEQFFNKVKINKELRMLDLKRNLEQKIQLCERAEELIVETSVVKAFKALTTSSSSSATPNDFSASAPRR
jgi:predicted ATPase with chaperone activity